MKEDEFKVVGLEFKKLCINKFITKDNSVDVTIFFNDGVDKEISKNVLLGEAKLVAEELVFDHIHMIKKMNKNFDGSEFTGNIKVVVKQEEEIIPKLTEFFRKVKENASKVRECKSADGYLNLVAAVNRMELVF